jgi:NAD(P)-dependent dehydrogenase (short-subunit alcohol dehydrogenase family)
MTTSLAGRTALVTGAGRGIGRAVAMGLARYGVTVALVARSGEELAESAAQVQQLGGRALTVPADLGDPDQVASIIERTAGEPAIQAVGSADQRDRPVLRLQDLAGMWKSRRPGGTLS